MKPLRLFVLSLALSAPSEARDSSGTPVRSIELLPLIDPKLDRVRGDWALEAGALVCARKMTAARIVVPYVPPEEYDLVIVAERMDGVDALTTGLVIGDRPVVHGVDGYTIESQVLSGFEMLDGKVGRDNESRRDGQVFTNGVPSTLRYVVRRGRVRFIADGKEVLDWQGDVQRLAIRPDYRTPHPTALSIGAWMSRFRISRMTLLPKSGEGRRLR